MKQKLSSQLDADLLADVGAISDAEGRQFPAVLDEKLAEWAERPRSTTTGYYDDAIAEAAAVMESVVQGRPFVDGNKRTGVTAADIHLRLNGCYPSADPELMADFIVEGLTEPNLDHAEIDRFLPEHSTPFGPRKWSSEARNLRAKLETHSRKRTSHLSGDLPRHRITSSLSEEAGDRTGDNRPFGVGSEPKGTEEVRPGCTLEGDCTGSARSVPGPVCGPESTGTAPPSRRKPSWWAGD